MTSYVPFAPLLLHALALSPVVAQYTLFRAEAHTSSQGSNYFGACHAVVGDLDADGYDDVIIGDPGDTRGGFNAGSLYVFSGRSGAQIHRMDGVPDDQLGAACCALGDVDGDAVPDFAVSGGDQDVQMSNRTPAFTKIISGRTYQVRGVVPGVGSNLIGSVDFDGDGVRDLLATWYLCICTYPRVSGGATCYSVRHGRVLWTYPGFRSETEAYGWSVATARDRNGDGVAEVLLGSMDIQSGRGSVRILSGATGLSIGSATLWPFGGGPSSLASIPDMDNDGFDEVVIGTGVSPLSSNPLPSGSIVVSSLRGFRTITGPPGHVLFGNQVAAFRDFDGDGVVDIIATSSDVTAATQFLHVLSGRTGSLLLSLPRAASLSPHGRRTVAVVDMNHDGVADIATSDYASSGGQTDWRVRVMTWVPGSYRTFGAGCRGTFGVVQLAGQGTPVIGTSFPIQLANLAPLWGGVVLIGVSDTQWGSISLPAPLDAIGMPGCTSYVSGDSGIGFLPISTNYTVLMPIPNEPSLLNQRFFNQAVQMDLRANSLGLVASNAAAAVIGT